jgi:NADPH:quinone reductase-like Zn-dependent oxidoreductase
VLDTVGGSLRDSSLSRIRAGGVLVSVVSETKQRPDSGIRSIFFLVDVTWERLERLSELFSSGRLRPNVGTLLRLEEARLSHEMLAGAPHGRGKIVLRVADLS